MRLRFAALFGAAIMAVPLLSIAAPTPTPAPRILIPEIRRPIITATPKSCTVPLPTTLTLCIPRQQPAFAPITLVDFQLTGSKSSNGSGGASGHASIQATITLAPGAAADKLEGWFTTNYLIKELDVYIPSGSTMNTFKNAQVMNFNENASGGGGTVVFTIGYQTIAIKNLTNNTTTMQDSWNAP